jgi:hypothetical protein
MKTMKVSLGTSYFEEVQSKFSFFSDDIPRHFFIITSYFLLKIGILILSSQKKKKRYVD